MAVQNFEKTYNAKADYSAKKGYAVYLNGATDGTLVDNVPVATLCGANAAAIGIITDPPKGTGYAMRVCILGDSYAVAGDTIVPGNRLKTDTNGALVPVASNNDNYIAIAQSSAASGDTFKVFVVPGQYGA